MPEITEGLLKFNFPSRLARRQSLISGVFTAISSNRSATEPKRSTSWPSSPESAYGRSRLRIIADIDAPRPSIWLRRSP